MVTTAPPLRSAIKGKAPGLRLERELWDNGVDIVAGVDEVGRGSWAGPLTLAAVVVPRDRRLYKVRDSKMLTEAERESMFDRLTSWCVAWSVGHSSHRECDEFGMSAAPTDTGPAHAPLPTSSIPTTISLPRVHSSRSRRRDGDLPRNADRSGGTTAVIDGTNDGPSVRL